MRQPVRPRIQLRERDPLTPGDNRHRIRRPHHLRLEQPHHRRAHNLYGSVIPPHQHPLTLSGIHHIHRRDRHTCIPG
ncbi:hypothetical protein, partial [Streptomyces hygroscopicus]|uniref:hypothetical protein n=1 Tax=Streptomyces hygroscopicus TaxID=1912 RepID=UPI0022400C13